MGGNHGSTILSTHQVQLPNTVMLCNGQSRQSSIKCTPCLCQETLLHKEFQICDPYPWHLVHADKSSLECVVQSVKSIVQYRYTAHGI